MAKPDKKPNPTEILKRNLANSEMYHQRALHEKDLLAQANTSLRNAINDKSSQIERLQNQVRGEEQNTACARRELEGVRANLIEYFMAVSNPATCSDQVRLQDLQKKIAGTCLGDGPTAHVIFRS